MVNDNKIETRTPEESLPDSKLQTVVALPQSVPSGFRGRVEFDLGQVSHPSFGSIHIKSSFPRLQPLHERPLVSREDLLTLQSTLLNWVKGHFPTAGKETYFTELTLATTLFTVYVNPLPPLFSQEMDLAIKIYFWLWIQDDELENLIETGLINAPQLMRAGTSQLVAILDGKYDTSAPNLADPAGTHESGIGFQDVENCEFFKPLFNSLLDLHHRSGALIPNYATRVRPTRNYLARYFEAMRWYAVDHIDDRYSEASFRNWRRIIAYFDGIAEVVALIHGVTLPLEIAQSPIFSRILDIANSFGGFVNDLVGMKKEFKNGQKDNLVVFKVLSKGQPLTKVVQDICTLMATELSDFVLLKGAILKEFRNEENLVRYLDILESLIDGHNRIYPESTRHRSSGCITLTR